MGTCTQVCIVHMYTTTVTSLFLQYTWVYVDVHVPNIVHACTTFFHNADENEPVRAALSRVLATLSALLARLKLA